MKNSLRLTCTVLNALAIILSALTPLVSSTQAGSLDSPPFDRILSEGFTSVVIENTSGRTQVQTWNSNRVRVMATREGVASGSGSLDAAINFERVAPTALKIAVRRAQPSSQIELSVYVPRHVNLTVRGGAEDVVIKGLTSALSVETATGAIALHLPPAASTDLSLRSIEGAITSKLPLMVFGPVNTHALDGRIGQGGAPVILRSTSGTIELVPDDPARLALAGGRAIDESTTGAPSIIKLAQATTSNGSTDDAQSGPADVVGHGAAESASSPLGAVGNGELRPGEEVVKVNVRTVNLNAKVTDAAGKLIPDLTKDDFQVFEDNVAQEVVHFEPITAPVNVVLLLDLSGSTKDRTKIMKKAAKKFIDSLAPNTRIAAAAFTRKFMLISDFTADRKLLKDRIDDVKNLNSGTAFYDSMWATLDLFKEVQERRKAVVVLTDGVDNSISSENYEARHPFDELQARMTQDDVTIYPIYFDTEYEVTVKRRGQDSHESYVTARKQLQRIADDTGGTLFKAERAEDLEGVYQRVASELHTFYSVAYNPKDTNYDGRWRNVSIQIKGRQAAVRTKRGFYAK
ncbi:MAG: VWA domain-containing protein [Pyrinomonadaceae bacterium]